MKHIFWLLFFFFHLTYAQKLKKADKVILSNLEAHVNYLADDKLEGRRTGSNGEKGAYEYISNEFKKAGLVPKGEKETYLQEFEINDGKEVGPVSHIIINGNDLKINQDYFPLSFSPNASIEASTSIALQESANPWFYDIKELLEANKDNPHFDLTEAIKTKANAAAKKGANGFIIFNTSAVKDELKFESKLKSAPISIPVVYISRVAKEKYLKDETATLDINLRIAITDKKRYGHNVIGYLNNNAPTTIVIGAHYDHLGYGEDHNSLFTGDTPEIHNGADDNASGTGALIELGKMLKVAKFKNSNYLVIAFSGEELGLFGSKYFTENPTVDMAKINYMINMDMIGRLKDSTRRLSIGGYGTSPEWADVLLKAGKYFTLSFDSSGTGPSDHTSFYRKNIPVLFFFTGTHSDYHKPTDDADKINFAGELQVIKFIYSLIEKTNKKGQLAFTKTRETQMNARSSFKVTLGIMPDYTYDGPGVRADGVTEGRIAQKAGIKAGDVITQLGDYKFSDMQTYMETLNKFNKGDATRVKVKRGNEELIFDIIF
ncbi:MAG: M28 family peptidase [Ferruginibacter sp.]|nr:M28 family peptidase [Ferruginibacter sp.]